MSSDPLQINHENMALVERMLRLSFAEVRTNSQVVSVRHGTSRRYALGVRVQHGDEESSIEHAEYDAVVYAAPLFHLDIDTSQVAISISKPSVA